MPIDEQLAERTREYLSTRPGYSQKKMFGGLCFLLNGHMCCGINGQDLMLRVGPDLHAETLARPGARAMDFTGRPLKGMVYVGAEHLKTDRALVAWVDTAVAFVEGLPPKKPKLRPGPGPKPEPAPSQVGGFSRKTIQFLRNLDTNNNRAWFGAHRSDYETCFVAPAQEFVRAIAPELKKLSKSIRCEPRINGSVFRINRDVRFSKDKTPYKAHLDFTFWDGPERGFSTPSMFLRIAPKGLVIGAGVHDLGPAATAFRSAVDNGRQGAALSKVLEALEVSYSINEPTLKRVPRGYQAEHPRADLLRRKGLTVTLQQRLPGELGTDEFVAWCVGHFRNFLPLHRWLLRALEPMKSN